MQSPTLTFVVRIDLHEGEKRNPKSLAKAIYRAISHATEVDIEGAELLDGGIGQISVQAVANKQLDSSGEPDKMLKASAKAVREQQGEVRPDTDGYPGTTPIEEDDPRFSPEVPSVIITPDPPDVPGCAWCVSQPVSPEHDPYCSASCAVMAAADDAGDDQ